MIVVTNISQVILSEIEKLKSLGDADKVTRSVAFDTIALVSDRVQQQGKKANGELIQSFYSKDYSKKRSSNGLQTSFVDLTFTGDMMVDFLPMQDNLGNWGAGFISDRNAQKARWNEERFGTIFELTNQETDIVEKAIQENIDKILR